jgi:hypothetical protein
MVVGQFVGRIRVTHPFNEGIDVLPYPAVVFLNELFM